VKVVVELIALPLAVGGRATTEVDRHVPDPSPEAANELRLPGHGLKVKPAKDSGARARVVVLHEVGVDPQLAPGVGAERFDEKATIVAMDLGLEDDRPLESRLEPFRHQLSAEPY
jgi:hypothetical protein